MSSGYISYEQLRVQLMLDLEALSLDPRGYPIDQRRPHSANGLADERPAALPPLPVQAAPLSSSSRRR